MLHILHILMNVTTLSLALLDAGVDVHAKGARGWTALHLACELVLEDVVQGVIGRGSVVDERDVLSDTPLKFASDRTTMLLLRAGASCEELPMERRVHLFHLACAVGDLLNVRTLLNSGCSVASLSEKEQEALLHCAFSEGDVAVVEALIDAGCDVNCRSFDSDGGAFYSVDTPLMKAAYRGHEEVVRKLIFAGANLAMQNDVGFTAAIHNHIQCAILLAEAGASVRIKKTFLTLSCVMSEQILKEPSRRLSHSPLERPSVLLAMQKEVRVHSLHPFRLRALVCLAELSITSRE